MAQTGYTPILIYASGTTGNTPSASNLTSSASGAELALNYFDGKLFYKDASGVVQVLAGKGGSGVVAGSNTQVQYNNNGVFGASANMVFNGTRLTVADFADSSLTSGRVTYATTGGNLTDSANLTFDGTNLTLGGGTANGVAYLNGSKVLTTGGALTFDGTTLTGTASGALAANFNRTVSSGPTVKVQVVGNDVGTLGSSTDGQGCFDVAATTSLYLRATGTGGRFIRFDADNSEQMRLTSTGLGIGTSSPGSKLDVYGAIRSTLAADNNYRAELTNSGGATQLLAVGTGATMQFWVGGSERVRVSNSGDVGIGTTSPNGRLQVAGTFTSQNNIASITSSGVSGSATGAVRALYVNAQTANTASSVYGVYSEVTYTNSQTNYGGYFSAGDPTGNSYGVYGLAAQTDVNGPGIAYGGYFKATAGSTGTTGITYGARIENAAAVGGAAYGLTVSTVAGASTVVPFQVIHAGSERARIDSSGNFLIGGTTANGARLSVGTVPNDVIGTQAAFFAGAKSAYAGIAQLPQGQLFMYDTNSTAGSGGAISFGGNAGGGQQTWYAAIEARKDNGTAGDYAGAMVFYTRPSGSTAGERMRITSSGDVGIGTSSPLTNLHVMLSDVSGYASVQNSGILIERSGGIAALNIATDNNQSGAIWFGDSNAAAQGQIVYEHSSDALRFGTAGSERARITSGGSLLVGTTTSGGEIARFQTSGDTAIGVIATNTGASYLNFGDTDDANVGFVGYNHASNFMNFRTNGAERARIDSSGVMLIGLTSAFNGTTCPLQVSNNASNQVLSLRNQGGTPYGQYIFYSGASPNNTANEFLYCSDTTAQRFTARSNGGLANYSGNNVNLSDRREKTNFAPAGEYLSKICAIPVQTFNYIDQNMEDDPGLTLGVVAQDVQAVAPELVMESNWGTKEEPKMRLSIYQTDLQYALMKCIQEQQTIIEQLKARLDAANL